MIGIGIDIRSLSLFIDMLFLFLNMMILFIVTIKHLRIILTLVILRMSYLLHVPTSSKKVNLHPLLVLNAPVTDNDTANKQDDETHYKKQDSCPLEFIRF